MGYSYLRNVRLFPVRVRARALLLINIKYKVMKGIIALDIDGTITADAEHLPKNVHHYLTSLAQEGWSLFFLTGRTFQWAFRTLRELPFPYAFALQNGAIILEMPARTMNRAASHRTAVGMRVRRRRMSQP